MLKLEKQSVLLSTGRLKVEGVGLAVSSGSRRIYHAPFTQVVLSGIASTNATCCRENVT